MLDTLEEWLYSEEADDAGLDVLRSKRHQVGQRHRQRFVVIRDELGCHHGASCLYEAYPGGIQCAVDSGCWCAQQPSARVC